MCQARIRQGHSLRANQRSVVVAATGGAAQTCSGLGPAAANTMLAHRGRTRRAVAVGRPRVRGRVPAHSHAAALAAGHRQRGPAQGSDTARAEGERKDRLADVARVVEPNAAQEKGKAAARPYRAGGAIGQQAAVPAADRAAAADAAGAGQRAHNRRGPERSILNCSTETSPVFLRDPERQPRPALPPISTSFRARSVKAVAPVSSGW